MGLRPARRARSDDRAIEAEADARAFASLTWPAPRPGPAPEARPGDDSPEARALRDAVRAANDHQFETAPVPTLPDEALRDAIAYAIAAVTVAHTEPDFVRLGAPIFEACSAALDRMRAEAAGEQNSLTALAADPSFERRAAYRQNCGDFAPLLLEQGLLDERGTWSSPGAPAIAGLFQRYRWAAMFSPRATPAELLGEEDAAGYARWRLSRQAEPAERRRALARLAALEPDYPVAYAEILIEAQSGDRARARASATRLANQRPGDPILASMIEALGR